MTADVITMRLPAIPTAVYDVVWDRMSLGAAPFPLTLRRRERDGTDAVTGRAHADEWLSFNHLGDTDHLDGRLAQALRSIATSEVALTTLYTDTVGRTVIGCFPTPGGRALRAVVRDGIVDLGWMHRGRMAEAILNALPRPRPGPPVRAIQVPTSGLRHASRAWRTTGRRNAAVQRLARSGTGAEAAARFLDLCATVVGLGQASAVKRTVAGDRTTAAHPLTFIDTTSGRFAVFHSYGSLTIVAADRDVVQHRIALLPNGDFNPLPANS